MPQCTRASLDRPAHEVHTSIPRRQENGRDITPDTWGVTMPHEPAYDTGDEGYCLEGQPRRGAYLAVTLDSPISPVAGKPLTGFPYAHRMAVRPITPTKVIALAIVKVETR
ncbi:MAG: hypothetical protein OXS35_05695 [Dehalococcoidia bacterium]|nr:hypothetical protein [Dehalococcoidia bacterium]